MIVLVAYDIQTSTPAGKKRLRHAARACLDFGQRVQLSVFELKVDPSQWAACKDRLLNIIDPQVEVTAQGTIVVRDEPGSGYRVREDLIEKLTRQNETIRPSC